MSFRRTVVLSLLLAGGLACGSSEPKQTPTAISLASSTSLTGVVGQPLTPAPEIVVRDQNGNPIAGIPVTITVSAGGGSITGVATSTTSGTTPIGTLTLGTVAGTTTITVNAAGLTPLVIPVIVRAGPPAGFAVVAGGSQSALAGTTLNPIQIALRDQYGNRAPVSIPVTFSVVAGGGTLAATTATSDATGLVTVPAFTLGKSVVPQTIRAQSTGFSLDIGATVTSSFNIDVRFFGTPMTDAQKALFLAAAARVRAAITAGRATPVHLVAPSADLAKFCNITGQPDFDEQITGVIIYASIQPIDGPRKILAQSGPCSAVQTKTLFFPHLAVMEFDSADLDLLTGQGSLQDVITHEMMHSVGFGTGWISVGSVTDTNTTNPRYTGAGGIQGCQEIGATTTCGTSVPVEGLPSERGTRDSHWKESVFINELMTGFLNSGSNPMSVMTIRSMADMGYTVNPSAADVFRFPGTALRAGTSAPISTEQWERRPPGLMVFDANGRFLPAASIQPQPSATRAAP